MSPPDLDLPAPPRWSAPLYLVLAILLVPWTIYLGIVLPDRTTEDHLDLAWVGYDVMIFGALALTAWFAYKRSSWVEVSATATATLLLVDAWFDITTATGGWNLTQAITLGVVVELPLAALSLWLALHTRPRRGAPDPRSVTAAPRSEASGSRPR